MFGSKAETSTADVNPDDRLQRTGTWLATSHDDTIIMMHVETGRFISLNATGGKIWEMLETPSTMTQLAARVAEQFKVTPEQAIADMKPLVNELLQNGALELAKH